MLIDIAEHTLKYILFWQFLPKIKVKTITE